MEKYIVVSYRNKDDLTERVNDLIEVGYKPVGSIAVAQEYPIDIVSGHVRLRIEHGMMFFQPMIRE